MEKADALPSTPGLPEPPLAGHVVRADGGAPVEDCRVTVYGAFFSIGCSPSGFGRVAADSTTSTDATGAFSVPRSGDSWFTLRVEAPGFAPQWVEVKGDEEPGPIEVVLAPAGSLRGRVLDAGGEPVPGARVFALPRDLLRLNASLPLGGLDRDSIEVPAGVFEDSEAASRVLSGEADAEGAYEVHGLAVGVAYHAYAAAPGAATSPVATDILGPAPTGAVIREFRLRLAASIRLVLQAPSGFEGREIRVSAKAGNRAYMATGKAQESVLLEGLDPGRAALEIDSEDFLDQELAVALEDAQDFERVVVLDPGMTVEGVVVDDRGEPVEDARVMAWGATPEEDTEQFTRADADEAGRFVLRGLPPGRASLIASTNDRGMETDIEVDVPGKPVRIVLKRFGGFQFRATWPGGERKSVRCGYTYTNVQQRFSTSCQDLALDDEAWDFLANNVVPGPVRGVFLVEGFVPVEREFEVKPGEVTDLGELRLDPGRTVKGVVLDDAGEGAGRARVRFVLREESWGANPETWATDEGRFVLRGLPPGRLKLEARGEGWESIPLEVDSCAEGEVVLRVERSAYLEPEVVDGAGWPQASVKVVLSGPDGSAEGTTLEDGRLGGFWAPGGGLRVRAGTYAVSLVRDDSRVDSGSVTLAGGETRNLRLTYP